jgi:hypothetical protein
MKVARDRDHLFFYARTAGPISDPTGPNWMLLFLDTDRNAQTGWHGYDFVVNRRIKDGQTTMVEQTRTGWNWQPKAEVKMVCQGNELMIAIPRTLLGSQADPLEFEFKWADNLQNEDRIEEFYLSGDAAPPGRFNYLFTTRRKD